MSTKPRKKAATLLQGAQRVLAVTHINMDGDAVGSLAALGYIMQALGAESRSFCASRLPPHLSWLSQPAPLVHTFADLKSWQPDCIVFLDCADAQRSGHGIEQFLARCAQTPQCHSLCIDHHMGNPLFAQTNWVDADYSSTGAMLGDLARDLAIPLSGPLGEALYLSLVSDTGTFSFANTNAQAMHLAADILEAGLDLAAFMQRYANNWTLNRLHLWGELLREVRLEANGRIAVSIVTDEHLERFGAYRSDLEQFASWLRQLDGVQVVLFARTDLTGSKLSLRSMGDINVQKIAAAFGGGGHKGAAGIDLDIPPHEAATLVQKAIKAALDRP